VVDAGEYGGCEEHAGAVLDPRAAVVRSVVGAACRVGAGARISGSVLLPWASVEQDAVVDGSILGRGVTVGAGARLTGVVVGDDEQIPPGAVLDGVRVPEPQ
jgi:mannose-1-phosphate guanylyltransferase